MMQYFHIYDKCQPYAMSKCYQQAALQRAPYLTVRQWSQREYILWPLLMTRSAQAVGALVLSMS